jgi:hypothetical protein|nr:MAG TPA: hypothetical protein [Bacteriophage sp.]
MNNLSTENRNWLAAMKRTFDSDKDGNSRTARYNTMMNGLDRQLSQGKLNQNHYDYLKNEITGYYNSGSHVPPPTPSIQSNPTYNNAYSSSPSTTATKVRDENQAQNNFIAANNYSASTSPLYDNKRDTPVASTNYHKEKYQADGKEQEAEAARYAKKTRENAMKLGQDEQATVIQRDAEKRNRADKQEQELNSIKARSENNIEQRRQDAEDLYRMQNDIALRNANASMAQATSSGVLMSAGEVDAIRNDTIAKYGTNIMNAKDFKNKTNTSLDEALTNLGLNIFKNKAEIDNFRNLLDNEKFAPILNALKAAHEGDQKAVTDVYNFYTEFNKKKAEEDYNRMMQKERYVEDERSFQSASLQVKERMIMDKLAETPGMAYTAQDIHRIISQYPDRSFAFILATAMEQAAKNQHARDQANLAIQSGQYKDMKGFVDPIANNNLGMVANGNTSVAENLQSWSNAAGGNQANHLYRDPTDNRNSTNPYNGYDSSFNRENEIRNNINNGIRNDSRVKQSLANDDIESFRNLYGYYSADNGKRRIVDELFYANRTARPTNNYSNNNNYNNNNNNNSGLYNKTYSFFESLKNDVRWNKNQGRNLQGLMTRARNTINAKVNEGVISPAQAAEMLRVLQSM